jgi:hypothetical protein
MSLEVNNLPQVLRTTSTINNNDSYEQTYQQKIKKSEHAEIKRDPADSTTTTTTTTPLVSVIKRCSSTSLLADANLHFINN